jgi:asparagine synthase (glutamine-hydrolysing)
MTEALAHRGPDASGLASIGSVTLGHRRLSIIDPGERSNQPLAYGSGVLAYNGELWNADEVRERLRRDYSATFSTTSDTEVVAAALHHEGIEAAMPHLDGMFAFAWATEEGAWLARDRFGKVPLFAAKYRGSWAWASERKALLRAGLSRGVNPVPPASIIDLKTGVVSRYYSIPTRPRNDELVEKQAVLPLSDLLRTAVKRRLVSDVPLCCLISGGMDSTLILALAKELAPGIVAYTASLDPNSPDLLAARRVCAEFDVELREVPVPPPTPDSLAHAVWSIETPMKSQVEIADLCLPLAERIAADGFKVCLSGEGADELFGGYGNMALKLSSQGGSGWRQIRLDCLDRMSRGSLLRCNMAFMAHGVECRVPFMDREVVERALCASATECPPGKAMLKRAARGIIPDWVISRPKLTFQGAAGMIESAADCVGNPVRFYNAEFRSKFRRTTQ